MPWTARLGRHATRYHARRDCPSLKVRHDPRERSDEVVELMGLPPCMMCASGRPAA